MKRKVLAGIDIGTNTFRLLIAEVSDQGLKELYSERIITRLGSGLSTDNLLDENAMDSAMNALGRFKKALEGFQVDAVTAVGTSALREAKNSTDFTLRSKRETGIDVRIISEEEEAVTTSLGILTDISTPETSLLIDIGGGSTELILIKESKIFSTHSLPLGVVYTADEYMKHDPLHETEINGMERAIREKVEAVKRDMKEFSEAFVLIGTGGTVTTLSALAQGLEKFDREIIHNSRLSRETVARIYHEISGMSSVERAKKYPILKSSRLDIIVPGTLILNTIMVTFGFKEIIASNNGLRRGLLINLYNRT